MDAGTECKSHSVVNDTNAFGQWHECRSLSVNHTQSITQMQIAKCNIHSALIPECDLDLVKFSWVWFTLSAFVSLTVSLTGFKLCKKKANIWASSIYGWYCFLVYGYDLLYGGSHIFRVLSYMWLWHSQKDQVVHSLNNWTCHCLSGDRYRSRLIKGFLISCKLCRYLPNKHFF